MKRVAVDGDHSLAHAWFRLALLLAESPGKPKQAQRQYAQQSFHDAHLSRGWKRMVRSDQRWYHCGNPTAIVFVSLRMKVFGPSMKAEILSIGSELTSGQNLDTNCQWLSRRLAEIGIAV